MHGGFAVAVAQVNDCLSQEKQRLVRYVATLLPFVARFDGFVVFIALDSRHYLRFVALLDHDDSYETGNG